MLRKAARVLAAGAALCVVASCGGGEVPGAASPGMTPPATVTLTRTTTVDPSAASTGVTESAPADTSGGVASSTGSGATEPPSTAATDVTVTTAESTTTESTTAQTSKDQTSTASSPPPESSSPPPESSSSRPPATDPASAGIVVTAADRQRAAQIVAGMSLADKAASVLMVTGEEAIGTGLLTKHPFGGVILFASGGVVDGTASGTPEQVKAVTAALRKDASGDPAGVAPLIATDQEYGLVQRLKNGFTSFPDAETIGSISDVSRGAALARKAAKAAGREMRAVGVTVDFAPVFGVTPSDGSASSIGQYGRSYGSNPDRVAELVAAVVTGYQDGGVAAVTKHFPGLARIGADSHVTLPTLGVTCKNWNAHEAIPAQAGVDAGTLMMMTGHVLLPAADKSGLPASVSPTIVDKLLRGSGVGACDGMGFTGVTVTDSLQMQPITSRYTAAQAAVAALAAGEDLLLMSVNPVAAAKGIAAAVKDGSLSQSRLDEAATAVLAVRIASARVPTPKLSVVGSAKHRAIVDKILAAAR